MCVCGGGDEAAVYPSSRVALCVVAYWTETADGQCDASLCKVMPDHGNNCISCQGWAVMPGAAANPVTNSCQSQKRKTARR